MDGHATKRPCVYDRRAHTAVTTQHGHRFVLVFREFDDSSPSFQRVFHTQRCFWTCPSRSGGLRVLFRLESQVKKVMTNWELETASSHYLNHAVRFRHVHVRPANIFRTRTVLHFPHFLFLKLTATEWRLFICLDDTDLKFIEVCAFQGEGAMTRLTDKIAQAVQTRNDYMYAMRRLVSDKQVKKIRQYYHLNGESSWSPARLVRGQSGSIQRQRFLTIFEYSMFCFRFGNLLVRLLVFEFRIIVSALVFSSISYLCDRRITSEHTSASFVCVFCFCKSVISFNLHEKESKPGTWTGTLAALATAAISGIPLARPKAAVSNDSSWRDQRNTHRSSWFIHFSFFVYYPSTSFLFQSFSACWLSAAWPVLFPAWGLSRKSETKKAGAVLVCGQASTVLVVAAWSHNRGHPPPPPSATITGCSTSFENRGCERPWFSAQVVFVAKLRKRMVAWLSILVAVWAQNPNWEIQWWLKSTFQN